jgi:hypothetical protein
MAQGWPMSAYILEFSYYWAVALALLALSFFISRSLADDDDVIEGRSWMAAQIVTAILGVALLTMQVLQLARAI